MVPYLIVGMFYAAKLGVNASPKKLLLALTAAAAFSFALVTFTFHLQATGALTTLEFSGRNAPSFDFLDNVSVTGVGVPDGGSTVSLLGCALLGLAALRRKLGW